MPHSAISSTVWPSTPVSPTTKDLVARFFHLVDQQDDNVGPLLAEEIFTPDARFVSANSAFEGKEGTFSSFSFVSCSNVLSS